MVATAPQPTPPVEREEFRKVALRNHWVKRGRLLQHKNEQITLAVHAEEVGVVSNRLESAE